MPKKCDSLTLKYKHHLSFFVQNKYYVAFNVFLKDKIGLATYDSSKLPGIPEVSAKSMNVFSLPMVRSPLNPSILG